MYALYGPYIMAVQCKKRRRGETLARAAEFAHGMCKKVGHDKFSCAAFFLVAYLC